MLMWRLLFRLSRVRGGSMSKERCGILTAPFGYVRLLEFGEWLGASLALRASLFPVGMKGED
ncbi:TPA: hypothetical protein I7679_10815 [Vibrio vulnificus]|nr:hypothetical protein [Vibrio vulnificus]